MPFLKISPGGFRQFSKAFAALVVLTLAACGGRNGPPAPLVSPGMSGQPTARPEAVTPQSRTPVSPSTASPASIPHPDRITVQGGETLYAISRRYGVPLRSIIEANQLTPPYRLNAGRSLVLPQVRQYVVQPGETLPQVSRRLGVDTSTLVQMNRLEPPYGLKIGQVLALPASPTPVAVAAAVPPPPRVVAEPLPEPARSPPPRVEVPRPPEPVVAPPAPPVEVAARPVPNPAPQSVPISPETSPISPQPPAAAPAISPPSEPPLPLPVAGKGFLWPVQGRVISAYGALPGGAQNDGINIAAAEGTPVLAADEGEVAYAGNELRGFGNLILIKHANGWMTAYAHAEKLLVKRLDKVKRGQAIARVGSTGSVGEPQLHFELRKGTRALDPTDYLPRLSAAKE